MNNSTLEIIKQKMEIIRQKKKDEKLNRCCLVCNIKIDKNKVCNKCYSLINNNKLKDTGYFTSYHKEHYKPVEEPKKRGRKPKPKPENISTEPKKRGRPRKQTTKDEAPLILPIEPQIN